MFKSLIFFARFFLFWLLFFAFDRFIFMFVFHKKLRNIPLSESLSTYYHAVPLDVSTAAYIAIIPLLYFFVRLITKKDQHIDLTWIKRYNIALVVIFSVISVANFNIYREWGSKINARVVEFAILTPSESIASSASSPLLLTLGIFLVLVITGLYLNFVITQRRYEVNRIPTTEKYCAIVVLIGLNLLLIRGSLFSKPTSQNHAYFSDYQILNHISINTEWNLVSSLLKSNSSISNPYRYTSTELAEKEVKSLYAVKKDTTISILSTNRPNVVIFLLESFTADLTQTLGGLNGVTPNLDSLAKNGILFSDIYATGNRTDKGLIGTLAGFPSFGIGSIVKWPKKLDKLPAISQKMADHGYETSFYYSGETNFDNYDVFVKNHNYQSIIDRNAFDKKLHQSQWGVYDGLLFNKQLENSKHKKQPFFSTILSLTNHEPFDVPGEYKFGKDNNANRFKSTAFYTDSCIGSYISEAKKQAWYKNTLFIFIADHGHLLPKDTHEIYEPQRYHIPLVMFGDVIKPEFRGKNFDKTGSQQDLAATLLAQLNIGSSNFKWSKNLLNPYHRNFAYFSWDNGFGFIEDKHTVTFDNYGKRVAYNSKPQDTAKTKALVKSGKAYIQTVYQNFINL
jgi:phosphoglycerol transferase MdoB-like AlkP superfamily enzyme